VFFNAVVVLQGCYDAAVVYLKEYAGVLIALGFLFAVILVIQYYLVL